MGHTLRPQGPCRRLGFVVMGGTGQHREGDPWQSLNPFPRSWHGWHLPILVSVAL